MKTAEPRWLGHTTRGFTAPNRLRRVDTYLAICHEWELRHARGLVVDLGFGASPLTTVEMHDRLRRLNPAIELVGVEIERERVERALAWERPGLSFREGGFNLPVRACERVALVRAINVLRQYDEGEVEQAFAALHRAMAPGGLLVEGTCNPGGSLAAFQVWRREVQNFRRLALVFAGGLTRCGPRAFQAVLPKDTIHHAEPGGDVDRFFGEWERAWQMGRYGEPQGRLTTAAHRLREIGYAVDLRPALLGRGFLAVGPSWPGRIGQRAETDTCTPAL